MNWYVKDSDGKVFGPADDAKLVEWAKDGRIEPFAGISSDRKTWILASLKPELEMDWILENEPGQFYGPTNRAVIDDLRKNGALTDGCRIYRDDHGGAQDQQIDQIRNEAESAMNELKAEAEKTLAEMKADAERTAADCEKRETMLKTELMAAMKEADDIRSQLEEMKKQLKAKDGEIEGLNRKIGKMTETKKREWKTEVVEPEIVQAEPPPAARDIFGSNAGSKNRLADLERQAQAELAKMGAANARKFFKFRG